jgi:hypothetical protein
MRRSQTSVVVRWLELMLVVCATLGLVGCNYVTGAAGITVADDDDDGDGSGAGTPTGAGGAGGVAAGGNGSGAGEVTTGTGGAPPTEQLAPVDGMSMTKISMYQAVERPLMENGSAAGSVAPVVAGREGLLRVFVNVDGYNGQPVFARLTVGTAPAIELQVTPTGNSSDGDLGSTINFDVPPELVTPGATFRVELLQPQDQTSGTNGGALYPVEGMADLQVETSGGLKVTLVPVQYNADGSGRLPDTSPAQIAKYEDLFYAMYPVTNVQIEVRNSVGWNNTISSNGNGWGNLLNAIADLRSTDNAAFDDYYYGIFEPSSSLSNYCSGGCVLGLGFVGGPQDDFAHSAIGIGFGGDTSVDTAVHELGHNHGREHAPCGGVSGADPNYPYSGAQIGAWGYNLLTGQLYSPSNHVDMMSYCDPAWISDYNFNNIFERVQFTSSSNVYIPPQLQNLTWDRVMIGPAGTIEAMGSIQLQTPPIGETVVVDVDTDSGTQQVSGRFLKYDHIEGGVLFVPPTVPGPKLVHAHINGSVLSTIVQ